MARFWHEVKAMWGGWIGPSTWTNFFLLCTISCSEGLGSAFLACSGQNSQEIFTHAGLHSSGGLFARPLKGFFFWSKWPALKGQYHFFHDAEWMGFIPKDISQNPFSSVSQKCQEKSSKETFFSSRTGGTLSGTPTLCTKSKPCCPYEARKFWKKLGSPMKDVPTGGV